MVVGIQTQKKTKQKRKKSKRKKSKRNKTKHKTKQKRKHNKKQKHSWGAGYTTLGLPALQKEPKMNFIVCFNRHLLKKK